MYPIALGVTDIYMNKGTLSLGGICYSQKAQRDLDGGLNRFLIIFKEILSNQFNKLIDWLNIVELYFKTLQRLSKNKQF